MRDLATSRRWRSSLAVAWVPTAIERIEPSSMSCWRARSSASTDGNPLRRLEISAASTITASEAILTSSYFMSSGAGGKVWTASVRVVTFASRSVARAVRVARDSADPLARARDALASLSVLIAASNRPRATVLRLHAAID